MTNYKKIQMSIMSIFVAAALLGSIVAVGGIVDNAVYAEGDGKKKKKLNNSTQYLDQSETTGQLAECFSESGSTTTSCNSVALSFNGQLGNNALGQD